MTRKRAPSSHSTQNQHVAGRSSRVAIFWFASKPEWVPLPNAAIAHRAALAPFGLNWPRSPRNRRITRSINGLLATR